MFSYKVLQYFNFTTVFTPNLCHRKFSGVKNESAVVWHLLIHTSILYVDKVNILLNYQIYESSDVNFVAGNQRVTCWIISNTEVDDLPIIPPNYSNEKSAEREKLLEIADQFKFIRSVQNNNLFFIE